MSISKTLNGSTVLVPDTSDTAGTWGTSATNMLTSVVDVLEGVRSGTLAVGAVGLKMKLVTGTSGSVGSNTSVAHSLDWTKIVFVVGMVKTNTSAWVTPGHIDNAGNTTYRWSLSYDATNTTVTIEPSASAVENQDFKIVIFYTD